MKSAKRREALLQSGNKSQTHPELPETKLKLPTKSSEKKEEQKVQNQEPYSSFKDSEKKKESSKVVPLQVKPQTGQTAHLSLLDRIKQRNQRTALQQSTASMIEAIDQKAHREKVYRKTFDAKEEEEKKEWELKKQLPVGRDEDELDAEELKDLLEDSLLEIPIATLLSQLKKVFFVGCEVPTKTQLKEAKNFIKLHQIQLSQCFTIRFCCKQPSQKSHFQNEFTIEEQFLIRQIYLQCLTYKQLQTLSQSALEGLKFIFLDSQNQDLRFQILEEIIDKSIDRIAQISLYNLKGKFTLEKVRKKVPKEEVFRSGQEINLGLYAMLYLMQALVNSTQEPMRAIDELNLVTQQVTDNLLGLLIFASKEQLPERKAFFEIVLADLAGICLLESLEFPISSLLVKQITVLCINLLSDPEQASESHSKAFLIDTLAAITERLQDILLISKEENLKVCYCGSKATLIEKKKDQFIQCEICQLVFHKLCIPQDFRAEFTCQTCQTKQIIEENQQNPENGSQDNYDLLFLFYDQYSSHYQEFHIPKQVLTLQLIQTLESQKLLCEEKGGDKSISMMQMLEASKDFSKNQKLMMREKSKDEQGRSKSWIKQGGGSSILQVDLARKALRTLQTKEAFKPMFSLLYSQVLKMSQDSSSVMRAHALRTLKHLVTKDITLMKDKTTSKIIFNKIFDLSASTREQALDLYIIALKKEFNQSYFETVLSRVNDKSLGLRKKIVQCLVSLLEKETERNQEEEENGSKKKNNNGKEIVKALISRLNDQQAVQGEMFKALRKFWAKNYQNLPQIFKDLVKDTHIDQMHNLKVILEETLSLKFMKQSVSQTDFILGRTDCCNQFIEQTMDFMDSQEPMDLVQAEKSLIFLKYHTDQYPYSLKISSIKHLIQFLEDFKSHTFILREVSNILRIYFLSQPSHQLQEDFSKKITDQLGSSLKKLPQVSPLQVLEPLIECQAVFCAKLEMKSNTVFEEFFRTFKACVNLNRLRIVKEEEVEQKKNKKKKNSKEDEKIDWREDKHLKILEDLGPQRRNNFHMRCIKLVGLYSGVVDLNALDRLTCDYYEKLFFILSETCLSKSCNQEVFELCMEAFGVLWLRSPKLLLQSNEVVGKMEEKFKSKSLNKEVKAAVLENFCKFMTKFDEKSSQEEQNIVKKLALLEKKLESLAIEGLNFPSLKVREAGTKLIINLFEQGLIDPLQSSSLFIQILNDCSDKSRLLAYQAIKELSLKSFQTIQLSCQPQNLVEISFNFQSLVFVKEQVSTQVKRQSFIGGKVDIEVVEDECVFEPVLSLFKEQKGNQGQRYLQEFINYLQVQVEGGMEVESSRQLSKIGFIAQTFFQSVAILNETKTSQLLQEMDRFIATNEMHVWEKFEKVFSEETEETVDKLDYSIGYLVFTVRLSKKLILKMKQKDKKQQVEEVEENKEKEEKRQKKNQRALQDYLFLLETLDPSQAFPIKGRSKTMLCLREIQKELYEEWKLLVEEKQQKVTLSMYKELKRIAAKHNKQDRKQGSKERRQKRQSKPVRRSKKQVQEEEEESSDFESELEESEGEESGSDYSDSD